MEPASNQVDFLAAAMSNQAFRRVVMTGEHEQVVVMTIPAGGEIGEEVHPHTDQVLPSSKVTAKLASMATSTAWDRTIWSSFEPGRVTTS